MSAKTDYVRSQKQTRDHHCHWPGCAKQVPPAMWGCKAHWFMLPKSLRDEIWKHYRPGQEIDGTPSRAYLNVAEVVQHWIQNREYFQTGDPKKYVPRPDEEPPSQFTETEKK